ncbi:uncharacterized protein LAJ45_01936 [Morchella importuna]|uniref:uncharacterized protein n=1 Tax=Morchella importuna TaxID=1174673 RepID=UPI001E8E8B50|nr:uncharacterized protein LAJ45_01936 [Morchella importuna]KAH8154168.1 hypothetical protein LAJ45_01936 [Morchella importuna]
MEASIDSPTVTKDEPLDFDDFGSLGMLMTGPITPASTAPSDLYIGTPCGDSPTPSYSESPGNSLSPTPGPGEAPKDGEKKPVKKRKSWGQVLPTPTTNLPPRKRAKTEPEKEQRRIERVIRNRQAAQTSRERKRLEYEALEKAKAALEVDNNELKSKLSLTERENIELAQRLSNLEQQVKMFQDTMNVARQIADKVNFSQSGVPVRTDIPSPVGSDDVPSRMSFVDNTLDPNTLFSNEASNASSPALDINVEALYETQQTAVLLCDLPLPTVGNNDIDDLFDSDAFSTTFLESQTGDQDSGYSTSTLFSLDSLVDYDQTDQAALATTSDLQPGLRAPIGSDGRATAIGVE